MRAVSVRHLKGEVDQAGRCTTVVCKRPIRCPRPKASIEGWNRAREDSAACFGAAVRQAGWDRDAQRGCVRSASPRASFQPSSAPWFADAAAPGPKAALIKSRTRRTHPLVATLLRFGVMGIGGERERDDSGL